MNRALVVVAAAGCAVAAGLVARVVHRQAPAFPDLPPRAAAGEGATAPCALRGVAPPVRCGVFRVPENQEAPASRTLDIRFVVLEATDTARRQDDAILLLPGGPGQALIEGAAAHAATLREPRQTRDVVVVDVRGVGHSGSLSCDLPFPGGVQSRFDSLLPPDHIEACRDRLASRAALDRYTTASSVDDLEALRRWLRYPQVNVVGGSYGTRVAQIYLRRHPQAVRTAVLNGVAAVAQPLYVQHAALLQRALDRLIDECAADAACQAAYPNLRAELDGLFARFRSGPVAVRVGGQTAKFTAGAFAYALRGLLYGRAAELPMMIHAAATGSLDALAEFYLERADWVGGASGEAGYHFSVLCAEDIAPLTDGDVARATRGTFMGAYLIDAYRAVCARWPHAKLDPGHWQPVPSDVPTLLLSGARDPVTPPESAAEVARHLTRQRHVVVRNGGHGVGGPCVAAMIGQLIESGDVAAIDTSCVAAVPPTRFRLPR